MLAALSLLCAAFSGCQEEGPVESRALLTTESEILLPAAENSRVITIYADGTWQAEVSDSWLTISPASGEGTTEITMHASYNSAETPRDAKIFFKGASTTKTVEISVSQKGDRFKDAPTCSVSELPSFEAGTLVKVSECQVMALTTAGFVVGDGGTCMFVVGAPTGLSVGDKVTMSGETTVVAGLAALTLEDILSSAAGTAEYPEPVDITETIAGYAPGSVQYVSFDGSYTGGKFAVKEKDAGQPVYPLEKVGLAALDMHYVGIVGYYIGTTEDGLHAFVVTSATDAGAMGTVYMRFEIETDNFVTQGATWPTEGKFSAVEGSGYITYVPYDLSSNNGNNKYLLDISGKDPRVTGPWPEDYWLFYGDKPVKSGSKVQIKFGTRTSATGHKYWILEYLDGKTWKVAGTPLVSTDMPEGKNVTYTHAMAPDGSTNIAVNETVVFTRNVEHLQFRFRCVANWQASGNGPLAARNGGTARLAIGSGANEVPQPCVIILEEGDGSAAEPVDAHITVDPSYITFEGTPSEPKTITVTSDQAYTLSASASWFQIDTESGEAGETKTVTVTCNPSELSSMREGYITVLAGETELKVPVIQSAAGQAVEPFISIVEGNSFTVKADAGTANITVQSNVDYEYEIVEGADWLSIAPATKAMVSTEGFTVTYSANDSETDRTARIRVFNSAHNLETVVTLTQKASTVVLAKWNLSASTMAAYADLFNTPTSAEVKAGGFGGAYLPANDKGSGSIRFWSIDKSALDVNDKFARVIGGTGEPYMTGVWPGDYWYLTANPSSTLEAGSIIHVSFTEKASGTGMKFWLIEYLDGGTWKPAMETSTGKVGEDTFTYNVELMNTTAKNIDFKFTLTAPSDEIAVRITCVANAQANGKGALGAPNGGTIRLQGEDSGAGLSPLIELVSE